MEIKNILDINLIDADLKVQTKAQVLDKLAQLLSENDYLYDKDGFIEDVLKREAEGQTGIGNFIAIPHGKSAAVNKIGLAIGVSQQVIPWESLDGQGAKVIILFAVGNDSQGATEHLRLLSQIARKLGNDEVVKQLSEAKNAAEVVAAFE